MWRTYNKLLVLIWYNVKVCDKVHMGVHVGRSRLLRVWRSSTIPRRRRRRPRLSEDIHTLYDLRPAWKECHLSPIYLTHKESICTAEVIVAGYVTEYQDLLCYNNMLVKGILNLASFPGSHAPRFWIHLGMKTSFIKTNQRESDQFIASQSKPGGILWNCQQMPCLLMEVADNVMLLGFAIPVNAIVVWAAIKCQYLWGLLQMHDSDLLYNAVVMRCAD